MARIILWGGLKALANGETEFDSEAKNVRALLDELGETHPGMKQRLDKGVSVAIDGEIFRNNWFAKIKPDSTVHVLPLLTGG